jgi:molecular chaperone GrpE
MKKKPLDKNNKNNMDNKKDMKEKDVTEDELILDDKNTSTEEETKKSKDLKNEKELQKSEEENLNTRLLRLQADFLNFKNRTEKEKSSTYGNAVADVIEGLLPIIDNLERALETDTSKDNSFKEGIEMIYNQFKCELEKRGLKEIEALHKPFDHNVHYGVSFDSETEHEDGIVIEVFQKGYTVKDKVIRPSMVKIAKK